VGRGERLGRDCGDGESEGSVGWQRRKMRKDSGKGETEGREGRQMRRGAKDRVARLGGGGQRLATEI